MNDLNIEHKEDSVTVFVKGEIDHHTARHLRESIDNAIDRARPKCLYLNMSGVTFMDSSGIGLIMGRYRLMQTLHGTLRVVGMSDHIGRLIRLAGLDKLPIYDNNRKEEKNETH